MGTVRECELVSSVGRIAGARPRHANFLRFVYAMNAIDILVIVYLFMGAQGLALVELDRLFGGERGKESRWTPSSSD